MLYSIINGIRGLYYKTNCIYKIKLIVYKIKLIRRIAVSVFEISKTETAKSKTITLEEVNFATCIFNIFNDEISFFAFSVSSFYYSRICSNTIRSGQNWKSET